MPLDFDVIVEIDAGLAPLSVLVSLGRQRPQRRLVQCFELRTTTAGQLFEGPLIECGEQVLNGAVQLLEREESLLPQARQDPTLDHLHCHFDFGFVSGL